MNKKILYAYAAGIIDGEGSIIIRKQKSMTSRIGYDFDVCVQVCNIRKEIPYWLKQNFGGSFYQSGKTTAGNSIWRWNIAAVKANKLLKVIYPYLLTKRQKAAIALEFQSKRKHWGRGLGKPQWAIDEDAEYKRRIENTP